ncbi:MAG: hypothetical protein CO020_00590 [Candidatus Colwellbacteria bacterium CG_4_9_14_0_2_um_filter_50_12]|uniref:Uncharacterized protein n=1 Tax=Candidatus Colwellbacteria bacterium CG_4_9_14_0_2_um_filter_50_12 TaxID=1974538 RepID=A0A2M8G1B4_9BACT|nr:MAG: hypothetical protein CO020_00590 [Candidatus Colwellbacteria bacterium CG_4_9_14_0_2_um_filter_50_12]
MQEATTQVCWMHSEEERRSSAGNWLYPFGLRLFSYPAALRLRRCVDRHSFLAAPGGYKEIARNAA